MIGLNSYPELSWGGEHRYRHIAGIDATGGEKTADVVGDRRVRIAAVVATEI